MFSIPYMLTALSNPTGKVIDPKTNQLETKEIDKTIRRFCLSRNLTIKNIPIHMQRFDDG
jgi:hypothetical protein